MPLENTAFLARQPQRLALFPQCIDALEQRFIHADLRIVPRHFRRNLPLQRLDHAIGIGACPVPEQRRNARKLIAGDFKRGHGVFEARRLRIAGNRIDFLFMGEKRCLESRSEILILDRIKFGQTVVTVPGHEGGIKRRLGWHFVFLVQFRFKPIWARLHRQFNMPGGDDRPCEKNGEVRSFLLQRNNRRLYCGPSDNRTDAYFTRFSTI
ncbi:hypothetical protein D3C86_1559440 [compost metagenome]